MSLIRCFIALELPQPVQKHLAGIISRLKDPATDIKWVDPQNTHLTLKFLGEITSERLKRARETLVQQDGRHGSIRCRTGQIGVFPGWSRPHVLWLGFNKGALEISTLQNMLENNLAENGYEKETKKFTPHLTLGRVRSSSNMGKLTERINTAPLEEIEFSFGELALIKSTLTLSGPIYQPLEKIELL
ncbi:RNA 2',3'-cyclic phosphodiesterase [candidate division TA06 bacterium]|uniref:RNA 2',3'-cyclic phosphodiesterase n=1 Tax=candidate division TA06 bacterium TaxID=2250710 RepID=A0A933I8D9_UNCT6|nr:RNA 2',3'-cyclic phosphodiesterase [candidate division TA06 bacterium]